MTQCKVLTLLGISLYYYFRYACGIQTDDEFVVSGGYDESLEGRALRRVISYKKTGHSKSLADLSVARYYHACGKYENDEGVTVSFTLKNN